MSTAATIALELKYFSIKKNGSVNVKKIKIPEVNQKEGSFSKFKVAGFANS
jgi:hypothetical protein